jgi:hypothetical protein
LSFAISTFDRFSGSNNPNGVYAARIFMDDVLQSEFVLDNIDYTESRYMNAHIDYKIKQNGGPYLQHLTPLPAEASSAYNTGNDDGVIYLSDTLVHNVRIEVQDANRNTSHLKFQIKFTGSNKPAEENRQELFIPNNVNVFETAAFEVYTTEATVYDTVSVTYSQLPKKDNNAVSPVHVFLSKAVPAHDNFTVRIKPTQPLTSDQLNRVVIKNVSGARNYLQKAKISNDGWLTASFRQFGTFQAFVDNVPPNINAPGSGDTIDLRRATRIVFTPTDNLNKIKMFRAEINNEWLMFTNDKGRSWIYRFDERVPAGVNELKVSVEDEAGNVTTRVWYVRR